MTSFTHRPKRLVLGSASPRRLEILELAGLVPDEVRPADIDETPHKGELPRNYVNRIAQEKAQALICCENEVVLCADTTVTSGRAIFGKPQNEDEARQFLIHLSGRRHRVITSVCVKNNQGMWCKDVVNIVKFQSITAHTLEWYLGTGEWKGKAGAYGIQGAASAFIPWISGSYHAIMGLPLPQALSLLSNAGYSK